jgi:peptidoglycan L-alanyl-D-glutamate endopeptidase CwlK
MDKITEKRALLIHPKYRDELITIIKEIDDRLTGNAKIRITQSLRTIKEQDALYAQGRTKPGPRVTNAQGVFSFHCHGLAIDICLIVDGKDVSWNTLKDYDKDGVADWTEIVNIFKKYNWCWGGLWTIKDNPHFEKCGYKIRNLAEKYSNKDFISGTTYLNL